MGGVKLGDGVGKGVVTRGEGGEGSDQKRRMGASIPTLEGWGRKETGKEGDDEWERMAMRIRAKKEDMEI